MRWTVVINKSRVFLRSFFGEGRNATALGRRNAPAKPCGFFRTALLLGAIFPAAYAGEKLVGTQPPDWQVEHWLNSRPLKLAELRGKVVLVRWWTAPDCSYCRATAPALNEFYRDYHGRGLEVIGFYHHKSGEQLRVADVKKYAKNFGFKFPVSIDPDWRTLKQWWLETGKRDWTSVSFLIDRHGVIRHIHPGGQYVKGDEAWAEMKARIEELLAEK
jgi:peroxiredoxin